MVSQVDMVVWFIGAAFLIFVVHPYMLSRKLKRDGLTKDAIIKSVKEVVVDPMIFSVNSTIGQIEGGLIRQIQGVTNYVSKRTESIIEMVDKVNEDMSHNIYDIQDSISKRIDSITIPTLPESIPSMDEIRTLVKDAATIGADHLEEVRKAMPRMIIATMDSQEAWAVLKKYEGRIYRMKGINIEDHQKGIDAAEQVYIDKIENDDPGDHSEIKGVVKDALKIAAEGGLIDPENLDQKIGMVEGIMGIAKRLKEYQGGKSAGKRSAGLKPAR